MHNVVVLGPLHPQLLYLCIKPDKSCILQGYKRSSMKRYIMRKAPAKSIKPCQPELYSNSVLNLYLWKFVYFLHGQGPFNPQLSLDLL